MITAFNSNGKHESVDKKSTLKKSIQDAISDFESSVNNSTCDNGKCGDDYLNALKERVIEKKTVAIIKTPTRYFIFVNDERMATVENSEEAEELIAQYRVLELVKLIERVAVSTFNFDLNYKYGNDRKFQSLHSEFLVVGRHFETAYNTAQKE